MISHTSLLQLRQSINQSWNPPKTPISRLDYGMYLVRIWEKIIMALHCVSWKLGQIDQQVHNHDIVEILANSFLKSTCIFNYSNRLKCWEHMRSPEFGCQMPGWRDRSIWVLNIMTVYNFQPRAFETFRIFQMCWMVAEIQGLFCECAQPMRDDVTL